MARRAVSHRDQQPVAEDVPRDHEKEVNHAATGVRDAHEGLLREPSVEEVEAVAVHDRPGGVAPEGVEVEGWGERLLSAKTAPAEEAREEGGEGVEAEGEVAETNGRF